MKTEIEYDDEQALTEALVGRHIVSVEMVHVNYVDETIYTLDDGRRLIAADRDGGCSCGNGDFPVTATVTPPKGVITGVKVTEDADEYKEHGLIRMFLYTDTIPSEAQELLSSEGYDNGYYGWGHHIYIDGEAREALDA